MVKLNFFFLLLLLLISFHCDAQVMDFSKNKSLTLAGTLIGDDVVLRWAVDNKDLLAQGQKNGFELTQIYSSNNQQVIDRDTLYLKPKDEWKASEIQDYSFQAAMNITFGATAELLDSYSVLDRFSIINNLFYFKLFLADISPLAANFMGLGLMNKNANFQEQYVCQLRILGVDSLAEKLQIVLEPTSTLSLKPIQKLIDSTTESTVKIQWNYQLYSDQYVAYNIERSLDNGLNYKQLNQRPFVPMTSAMSPVPAQIIEYADSTLSPEIGALYRIRGISFFGSAGPYSQPLKITLSPRTNNQVPILNNAFENDNSQFEISWNFDESAEQNIAYFSIERSIDGRKSYSTISGKISSEKRFWIDPKPSDINFYNISAIDKNGYKLKSVPILGQLSDNIPPNKPSGLIGKIDSSGQVNLSWNGNKELDLLGYYVFYSNTKEGEYSILTHKAVWKDTFFTDSIYTNTLADKIYYKIMALDFRGNQSTFSDAAELKRPDFYPPTPAVFKRRESRVGSIYIEYTNSSSSDLVGNELQRSTDQIDWQVISKNSEKGTSMVFIDSLIDCRQDYYYRIISKDDDDLTTNSKTLQMTCIDNGERSPIQELLAVQIDDKKLVQITCTYPISSSIKSILIYRSENGDSMKKIKQFWKKDIDQVPDFDYVDRQVRKNSEYQYKVVMRFEDNGFAKSPTSNKINIK